VHLGCAFALFNEIQLHMKKINFVSVLYSDRWKFSCSKQT